MSQAVEEALEDYLAPAPGVSCDEPELFDLARSIARGAADDRQAGARLFAWVRETVVYNPYTPYWDLAHYRASATLMRGHGYCVQKAALLAALARSLGIPARLGFADIRNHLLTEKLRDYLGADLMTFHAWTEMFLGGQWLKATPAFERALCDRFGWRVVEFDGTADALLPATDLAGRPHVEYLTIHPHSPAVPLADILAAWERVYGTERLAAWRERLSAGEAGPFTG